ncbi:MAG: hypothetical protein ACKO2P_01415 [Planctomycetota bacterium]
MATNSPTDALQQRTQEICRLLAAGKQDQATTELAALDSLLLDSVSNPLAQLVSRIAQLRADGDPGLQLAFRRLKQTAEHTQQLLRTIPRLCISGPHIRLATESILERVMTLRDITGELPLLQSELQSLAQAGSHQQQAAVRLQASLTTLNSRLGSI